MEPGGSMPHSQWVSNNPYPEQNQLTQFFISIDIECCYNEFRKQVMLYDALKIKLSVV